MDKVGGVVGHEVVTSVAGRSKVEWEVVGSGWFAVWCLLAGCCLLVSDC